MRDGDKNPGRTLIYMAVALALWGGKKVPAAPSLLPENAALLYYQAFSGAHDVISRRPLEVNVVLGGRDPNDGLRRWLAYNKDFHQSVRLVDLAVELPLCDWGAIYAGPDRNVRFLTHGINSLERVLMLNAHVLVFEGRYRTALEVALKLPQFADHIGDGDYVLWNTSVGTHASAFRSIRYVLGRMPPEAETLMWLKREIAHGPRASWSPRETLAKWRDMEIRGWQAYPDDYARRFLYDSGGDKNARSRSLDVESVRAAHDLFLEQMLAILEDDVTYEVKRARIKQLTDRVMEKAKIDDATAIMVAAMHWWEAYYQYHVSSAATINAVKTALEIYLVTAKEGHLPQTLPEELPQDPFSGQDFEYQLTDEGFRLRCRVAPIDFKAAGNRLRLREYDFKVAE